MPGAALALNLPIPGTTTWAEWATLVNEAFTAIKNDLEPLVRSDEFTVVNDIQMNNYSIEDASFFTCRNGNASAVPTNSIGMRNGNWFATDSAGNTVQITSAGALATSTGGITGDYVSSGADVSYDFANDLYAFQNPSSTYSDIRCDDLILSSAANTATLSFGGSVNTAFTLPTTMPAGAAILSYDGAGQLSHSATIATAATFSANITLSGAADIKHPDRTEVYAPSQCISSQVTSAWSRVTGTTVNIGGVSSSAATVDGYFEVPGLVGNRIKAVSVRCNPSGAAVFTFNVYKGSSGALGASLANGTSVGTGAQTVTCTLGAPSTIAANEVIFIRAQVASGSATQYLLAFNLVYDRV